MSLNKQTHGCIKNIHVLQMNIASQITHYINSLPATKSAEMLALHNRILQLLPDARLWFLDGKDGSGKVVSNPNIGYGMQKMQYADGKAKDFYQIGLSANTTGISVYIMGLDSKTYLPETYGKTIGKASVTGYCIKFKTVKDIDLHILEKAILDGARKTG